jgi:hypothetical protein
VEPNQIALTAVCAFFAVAFLQSGTDKLADWRGNREFLEAHFAKSPLRGGVGPMLGAVTVAELASGAVSSAGAVMLVAGQGRHVAVLGLTASAATLLMLFFGQRVVKDYAGAAVLAAYYAVAVLGILAAAGVTGR